MFGIGVADWITLVVYLSMVTAIGLWSGRFVKNTTDFLMPRTFGRAMMLMHAFGTGTTSDQAVSVASKSYTNGISGIWYQWQWLFATPFYWLVAPMMRRFRALTMADVFEARFNRSVGVLYAFVGVVKFVVNMGLMLKGSSVVIEACSGGRLPADQLVLVMTVLFVGYGMFGGLRAAIYTDFVQGFFVIIFSFLLVFPLLNAVGGWTALKQSVSEMPDGNVLLALVAPGAISGFYILMISINSLVSVVALPQNLGVCGAGRTEMEGAVGYMGGNLLKRICTIPWAVTGVAALVWYGGRLDDPDLLYGMVAREFLPPMMPGLLGIFIASLLATVMGSCDSFMVSGSGLVVENLYRPLVRDRSERHYLIVARIAGVVIVGAGILFAYWLEGVVQGLEFLWRISGMMGIAFWLGVFWRRMTAAGAWASTLAAFGVWWLTSQPDIVATISESTVAANTGIIIEQNGRLAFNLPWQIFCYLSGAIAAGIAVSLMTRATDHEKLERFYGLLRTPVRAGEQPPCSCQLPDGAVPGPRRVWFPTTSFEIPVPSRRAVAGFLVGWCFVFALIATMSALL